MCTRAGNDVGNDAAMLQGWMPAAGGDAPGPRLAQHSGNVKSGSGRGAVGQRSGSGETVGERSGSSRERSGQPTRQQAHTVFLGVIK